MPATVTIARRTFAVVNCMQKDSDGQYPIAGGKTATFSQSAVGRRAYSFSAPADHKIWSFESVWRLLERTSKSPCMICSKG